MVQALDLTFDRTTDARVRTEWESLRAAGLPSLARHTAPSNRPHVTLDTRDTVTAAQEDALGEVAALLPLQLRVGSLLLFRARRRWVMARHVVVDEPLLGLHERLHGVLGSGGGALTVPGRWVPHVSLARGVPDEQLSAALAVVAGGQPFTATAVRLRLWDEDAGEARDVARAQSSTGRSL